MLDGKSYYTAFPDENSEERARMQSLFDKIAKLDRELRRNVEELRDETPRSVGTNNP
jgi:hypothetical protein